MEAFLRPASLYTRLFKYSPREGYLPLENFLTECLCDFLDRLTVFDRQASELFIFEILCGPNLPPELRIAISRATILQWKTQRRITVAGDQGIVDLWLAADNNPVLIIENKINAGFTSHRASDGAEDPDGDWDEGLGQLDFYEKYLRAKGGASALILLTYRTEAPGNFNTSGSSLRQSGTVFRRVRRWTEIYKWLSGSGSRPQ